MGLFQRSCEGGIQMACVNLGVGFALGQGVQKDLGRARALFSKACDAGEDSGCKAQAQLPR